MSLHEIDEKVAVNIRPELAFVRLAAGAGVNVGVPVTLVARRVAGLVPGPYGPVVEAMFFQRVRLDAEVVDLPLAGDGCGVAGGFHHLRKRVVLGPVEVTDTPARDVPVVHPAGAPGVLAGEQRGTGWRALRHRPRVVKLEAAIGQAVDVRRLNVVRAIAGDPVLAEVVHHDEQDVRLGCGDRLQAKRTKNRQGKIQALHGGQGSGLPAPSQALGQAGGLQLVLRAEEEGAHVLEDKVHRGDKDQRDDGGEDDAEAKRDAHRH